MNNQYFFAMRRCKRGAHGGAVSSCRTRFPPPLVAGDDVAATLRGAHHKVAQPILAAVGHAALGAAGSHEHVVVGAAFGANGIEVGGIDAHHHIHGVLHRARGIKGYRLVAARGRVEAHDEQHAAIAGVGVGVIGKIGRQLLGPAEESIIAHTGHTIGVPQGISAQVEAHGVGRHLFVVHFVASRGGEQRDGKSQKYDFFEHKCSIV